MQSWLKRIINWLILCLLGLAGAANAAGVGTLVNVMNGTAGVGALRSDGAVLAWGQVQPASTVPIQMGGIPALVGVDNAGNYGWTSSGTVFDFYNGVPVAGLSPVKGVVSVPDYKGVVLQPVPSFAATAAGNFLYAFSNVQGMSGVQSLVAPVGVSGVSGVMAVSSVVPRPSQTSCTMTACTVWVWAIDNVASNLFDVQSTLDQVLGMSNVVATPVAGISNVIGITELDGNNFAVRSDGTVWAWGPNVDSTGKLFQSMPPVPSLSPVQVPGLTNVSSITATKNGGIWSRGAVFAVTATGAVWAWGNNTSGQLGDNQTSGPFSPVPVQVQGLTNVAQIVVAGRSVLALTVDGSVWGWGENYSGPLGDGTNINRYVPVQVGGLSPLTGVTSLDIAPGYVSANQIIENYAVAAKADGSVWAWGDNSVGQLGDGTLIGKNTPVRVLGEGGMGFLSVQPAILTVLKNGAPLLTNPSYVFANQAVGTTSAAQTMTFTNAGLVTWTGFSFQPSVGDFAQTNNCGASLAPGASCTMNITFTPIRAGLQTVTSQGGMGNSNLGGSIGTMLTGTGIGARAVLSSSLSFGIQKTATATTKTVTLSNAGSTALTVGAPGVTGAGFTLGTTTCGAPLAAGASCTVNVIFTPPGAAAYTGTLTFPTMVNPGGAPSMALSGTGAATASTRGDFNADGMADILWRDMTTGANAIWLMNSAVVASAALIYTVPPQWAVAGMLDFNGDAKSDILWRDSLTGTNVLWFMNGASLTSGGVINSATPDWIIAGTADFNGDGQNDILWFNNNTRQVAVWLMNAGQVVSAGFAGGVAQGWSIAGVGDFDGDGKADILWRNQATGANSLWLMNGASLGSAVTVATGASTWSVAGIADFNGDGKADILWRDSAGNNAMWLMNGSTISSAVIMPSAAPIWTVAKVADFNGDGKADILWRDTAGNNAIWFMNGAVTSSAVYTSTGATNWTVIKK